MHLVAAAQNYQYQGKETWTSMNEITPLIKNLSSIAQHRAKSLIMNSKYLNFLR